MKLQTSGSMLRYRNGWSQRRLVASIVLVIVSIFITADAWSDILRIALRDEESSYILLAPLIAIWLAWLRRGRLRHCRVRGLWIGPVMIAIGWTMYSVGDRFLWQSIWHGGAILIAVGSFLSLAGGQILLDLLPAFAALMFIVPVPGRLRQAIALPLQTCTAQITQQVFFMLGILVQRSGNLLSFNGTDVAIVEACNGLRMVFALSLVSYAFAFASPLRGYVRVLIILASPLSAVLCNVVRLVPTVWIYGRYPGGAGDWFHTASAWVMLFVAFASLVGIIRFLRWASVPVSPFMLAHD